jgi:peptidoglycan/xylan/chitin deacetylase (PgdA/CDA1 family)
VLETCPIVNDYSCETLRETSVSEKIRLSKGKFVTQPSMRNGDINEKYITISVDDGHPTDLRTVDLLHKYGLTATFYIPATNFERTLITPSQARDIDRQFEVGSHTISHIRLTHLSDERARQEIVDGKKQSEDTLGHEVVAFCYPGGKFNRRIEQEVEEAGFLAARTCRYFLNDFPKNPFSWDISTYANTYPAYVQVRHCLLEYNFEGAYRYLTTFKARVPWVAQFVRALDDVSQNGGMAHLYFHSWEIDQNGEWDKLEELFKIIAQYKLTPVTNSYLFRLWHERRALVSSPLPA